MTKCYAVFYDNYDAGFDLKGLFTTRKKAEDYITAMNTYNCSIVEVEFDPDPAKYDYYWGISPSDGDTFYDGRYHK